MLYETTMSSPDYSIQNKVVLVTGCASGIGLAIVKQLLKYDIKGLYLLDIQEDKGKELEDKISSEHQDVNVKFRKCDLSEDTEVVAAYYEGWLHFGYIDVVINNAGIVNESKWKQVIKVNLWSVIESSLQAWGRMRKDRGGLGGTIINVSSIASVLKEPMVPVYSGTKAGVKMFSESLGDTFHYGRTNVRVVTVCPMLTDTPILLGRDTCTIDAECNQIASEATTSWTLYSADDVAKSILEVYRTAPTGTSWIVTDSIKEMEPMNVPIL